MFWITSDPVVAGHLQRLVADGRVDLRLRYGLVYAPLLALALRTPTLGLTLDGVEWGRSLHRWEHLEPLDPIGRTLFLRVPIRLTHLNLNPEGARASYGRWGRNRGFDTATIPRPTLGWSRLVDLVTALAGRQSREDDRLRTPAAHPPASRPEAEAGTPVFHFVDGENGEIFVAPRADVADQHRPPASRRTAWHGYTIPRVARPEQRGSQDL